MTDPALPKVRFKHQRGSREGEVQLFHQERIRLGRRPDNDIVFDEAKDRACSGYHCELFYRAGEFHVRDAGSANGTYVNGERVTSPTPVRTGDELGLGTEGPVLGLDVGENIGGTMRMDSGEQPLAEAAGRGGKGRGVPATAASRQAAPRAGRSAAREAALRALVVVVLAAVLYLAWRLALG